MEIQSLGYWEISFFIKSKCKEKTTIIKTAKLSDSNESKFSISF